MRPSGRRWLLWLLLFAALLAAVLAGYAVLVGSPPGRRPAKPQSQTESRPLSSPAPLKPPGLELQGTRLRVIDPRTGRAAWELTLTRAEAATETGEVWLTGIKAAYHNPDGSLSRLSAARGHLEAGGRALVLTGQVRLAAENGGSLSSEELRWDAGQEEFVATAASGGEVTFTRGESVLRAKEIRGDLALKKVRASGGVRLSGRGSPDVGEGLRRARHVDRTEDER